MCRRRESIYVKKVFMWRKFSCVVVEKVAVEKVFMCHRRESCSESFHVEKVFICRRRESFGESFHVSS